MLLILCVCSVLAIVSGQNQTAVNITQGRVIGSVAEDGEYFQFYGIPYADSTSGSHRFKAPLPAPSFQQDFVANRRDIKCVHALGIGYDGTEDCLVANIFTPTLNNTKQLPVMVWIKGREFDKEHEIELSFKNFVEKEVVVVSLNYRESVLGFLCLGTETAPGNAGLKDIIAGLRWVKENIAQFGGNPNNITLFGHGSGAAAVDLVTLSPMANGLVHKAIAQSGNAMAPWAVSRDNLEYAVQVAEALGHVVTNIQELSNVFTRTSVAALMAVINELDLTDNSLAFAPCIEKSDLEGVEPFLVRTPAQIIAAGDFLQIPFLTGFVDNEGTIRAKEAIEDEWLDKMESSFTDFLQPDLKFNTTESQSQVAQSIRSFYFGDSAIDISAIDEYIEYHGDTIMLVSTIREVRDRAAVSRAPTYLYQFSYKGTLSESLEGPITVESAAHSEELAYMFYGTPKVGTPMRDLAIGDILVERWTNFAKTGIPTSESSQVLWQPFTTLRSFFLRILDNNEITDSTGATLEVSLENPHVNTIAFWEQIYQAHFMDAESNWNLTKRTEDEDEDDSSDGNGGGNGEDNGGSDGAGGGESDVGGGGGSDVGGGGETDGNGNGEGTTPAEEDNDTDSASTAVGYTFLIVTLFSILNHFHSSQILS